MKIKANLLEVQRSGIMGYQPLERLLPKSNGSIYRLARLAALRAAELADNKPALVLASSTQKIATTALEEILHGRVALKEAADQLFNPKQELLEQQAA